MPTQTTELLRDLNEILRQAQRIVIAWRDPRGLSDAEACEHLTELLEGTDVRVLQARVAEIISERPLFFAENWPSGSS